MFRAETKIERTPLSSFNVDGVTGNGDGYRRIYGGRVQQEGLEDYQDDWKERFLEFSLKRGQLRSCNISRYSLLSV